MRLGLLLLAISLLVAGWCGAKAQPAAPPLPTEQPAAPQQGGTSTKGQPGPPPTSRYSLTPEKREKAIAYSRTQYVLYFVGVLVSIVIYLLLWRARVAVVFRDWARQASRRHFVQCLVVVPLFLAVVSALNFPLEYFSGFVLEHRYDLSTESLGSWLGDWGKTFAITTVLGVVAAWIFYWIVRRSPRRWWLYFWVVSIPLVLALIVVEPYVIEPLFYRFTPLARSQPVLTERIEEMLQRAGLKIPSSRIYEMNASAKTKALDAYVSGLGASKRVVIWDTTLGKMDQDEGLLVLGHELGHYVLDHIPKEYALDEMAALLFFFLGFVALSRIMERSGARKGVEGAGDLASLPIVLLVLTVLVFFASPIVNGISRHYEHQADQFGLEVAYGVVPDPNTADVQAFQILGEEDLADPDPNPFITFWLYSHPPLDQRIRFAASYKPWAEGKPLEFVRPPAEKHTTP
jgi:STE24 endopeptidase